MRKSIWDISNGKLIQIAPPSTNAERAEILRQRYNGQECGIPHGGEIWGCDGENAENVMIIPEDKHPDDYDPDYDE